MVTNLVKRFYRVVLSQDPSFNRFGSFKVEMDGLRAQQAQRLVLTDAVDCLPPYHFLLSAGVDKLVNDAGELKSGLLGERVRDVADHFVVVDVPLNTRVQLFL